MDLRCTTCGMHITATASVPCPRCLGTMESLEAAAARLHKRILARRQQEAASRIQRAFRLTRAVQATMLSERVGPPPPPPPPSSSSASSSAPLSAVSASAPVSASAIPARPPASSAPVVREPPQVFPITIQRQQQLRRIDDSYLTGLFGLRLVADMTGHEHESDLLIGNQYNSSYLRDAYDKQWGSLKGGAKLLIGEVIARIRNQGRSGTQLNGVTALYDTATKNSYWLVNSPHALARLGFLCVGVDGKAAVLKAPPRILDGGEPGLHILVYQLNIEANEQAGQEFKEFLKYIGATPSTYQMYKFLNGRRLSTGQYAEPALGDGKFAQQNHALLRRLLSSREMWKLATMAQSSRPMRTVYDASVRLLRGLENFTLNMRFNRGLLVQDSLQRLENIVRVMAFYDQNAQRCRRAYDLLLDELFLILAAVRPYSPATLPEREAKIQDRRMPTLAKLLAPSSLFASSAIQRTIHAAWSGMDALTTAIEAAIVECGRNVQLIGANDQATYFEVGCVLAAQGLPPVQSLNEALGDGIVVYPRVLMATLHPSTPEQAGPTPQIIAGLVIARHARLKQPVTLIIDSTIQVSPSVDAVRQLDDLVSRLQVPITQGQVQLILARSYQKYSQLGSGKFMGGCTTLIHDRRLTKSAAFLRDLDSSTFRSLDEVQFFCHLLTHASDDEVEMATVAAQNANFVATLMPNLADSAGVHVAGSPFVLKNSGNKAAVKSWIERLGLAEMDSFGFTVSAYLDIPPGMRINPGQESRGRLIEKFFAVGHLWNEAQRDSWGRNLPFVNVLKQIDTILEEVNAAYSGAADEQAFNGNFERLPFSPIHPAASYVPPAIEAMAARYRRRPRKNGATDLTHVLASYLSVVFRFSRVLVRFESTPSAPKAKAVDKPALMNLTAEDQLTMVRLCRALFERGLLSYVTPEMRVELAEQTLRLLLELGSNTYDFVYDRVNRAEIATAKDEEKIDNYLYGFMARLGRFVPWHGRRQLVAESRSAAEWIRAALDRAFVRVSPTRAVLATIPTLLASSDALRMPHESGPTLPPLTGSRTSESLFGSLPSLPVSSGISDKEREAQERTARLQREAAARLANAGRLYRAYVRARYIEVDNPGGGDCMYYAFDDGRHRRTAEQAAARSNATRLTDATTLREAAAAEAARLIERGVGVSDYMFRDMLSADQLAALGPTLTQASLQIHQLQIQAWARVRTAHNIVGAFNSLDPGFAALEREAEADVVAAVRLQVPLQALLRQIAAAYQTGQQQRGQWAGDLDLRSLVLATGINLRIHYVDSSAAAVNAGHAHRMTSYLYDDLMATYYQRVVAPAAQTVDILHVNDNHYVSGLARG